MCTKSFAYAVAWNYSLPLSCLCRSQEPDDCFVLEVCLYSYTFQRELAKQTTSSYSTEIKEVLCKWRWHDDAGHTSWQVNSKAMLHMSVLRSWLVSVTTVFFSTACHAFAAAHGQLWFDAYDVPNAYACTCHLLVPQVYSLMASPMHAAL